jgi:hypothetical protein
MNNGILRLFYYFGGMGGVGRPVVRYPLPFGSVYFWVIVGVTRRSNIYCSEPKSCLSPRRCSNKMVDVLALTNGPTLGDNNFVGGFIALFVII